MTYELLIVGGGPAGVAAGVYAGRKRMKTAIVTDSFGGQSLVSADVQNWIGTKSISGLELAKCLEEHLRAQEGVDIFDGDLAEKIDKKAGGFSVRTKNRRTLDARTILVATGSHRKHLQIPGEREFEGKGVVFCSTCDAPLFGGKTVTVIGGGNAGLEAVNDLLPYASKIYLLEYESALRGDPITQEKIVREKKVSVILSAAAEEIVGDTMVREIRYKDRTNGESRSLPVDGVFVEIGIMPSSDCVSGLVELNQWGEIVVDHKTQATSLEGIWAAGDVTDALYRQNNVSVGDAVTAVLNIYDYLNASR